VKKTAYKRHLVTTFLPIFIAGFAAILSPHPLFAQDTIFSLDINSRQENSAAQTEQDFTAFSLAGNPATINGVTVLFEGTLDDRRRTDPTGMAYEQVLRDFIFGSSSDVQIHLSGLQANTTYTVIMYAYDTSSNTPRHAVWTANGQPLFETLFDGAVAPASAQDCRYSGLAVSDAQGRIQLQGVKGAGQAPGQTHYCFINALILEIQNSCYNAAPQIQAPDTMVARVNTSVLMDITVTDMTASPMRKDVIRQIHPLAIHTDWSINGFRPAARHPLLFPRLRQILKTSPRYLRCRERMN